MNVTDKKDGFGLMHEEEYDDLPTLPAVSTSGFDVVFPATAMSNSGAVDGNRTVSKETIDYQESGAKTAKMIKSIAEAAQKPIEAVKRAGSFGKHDSLSIGRSIAATGAFTCNILTVSKTIGSALSLVSSLFHWAAGILTFLTGLKDLCNGLGQLAEANRTNDSIQAATAWRNVIIGIAEILLGVFFVLSGCGVCTNFSNPIITPILFASFFALLSLENKRLSNNRKLALDEILSEPDKTLRKEMLKLWKLKISALALTDVSSEQQERIDHLFAVICHLHHQIKIMPSNAGEQQNVAKMIEKAREPLNALNSLLSHLPNYSCKNIESPSEADTGIDPKEFYTNIASHLEADLGIDAEKAVFAFFQNVGDDLTNADIERAKAAQHELNRGAFSLLQTTILCLSALSCGLVGI